ncbi:hypothetical protein Bbelb_238250 [Branchiostoma belcheri]|nr:hypothetical protein Bbelb_238250 [Branchiostoma belcheri]
MNKESEVSDFWSTNLISYGNGLELKKTEYFLKLGIILVTVTSVLKMSRSGAEADVTLLSVELPEFQVNSVAVESEADRSRGSGARVRLTGLRSRVPYLRASSVADAILNRVEAEEPGCARVRGLR